MRRVPGILYWPLVFVLSIPAAYFVCLTAFGLLDATVGATRFNFYGDMEGLVLQFWAVWCVVWAALVLGLSWLRLRQTR